MEIDIICADPESIKADTLNSTILQNFIEKESKKLGTSGGTQE